MSRILKHHPPASTQPCGSGRIIKATDARAQTARPLRPPPTECEQAFAQLRAELAAL